MSSKSFHFFCLFLFFRVFAEEVFSFSEKSAILETHTDKLSGGIIVEFSWRIALFIFCIQLFSYIIKWIIGFGEPLLSAPLLSMRLDNALITPGSLLPSLCINASITWQNRRHFDRKRILPLLFFMLLGDIPGTWLLRFSMPWLLKTVLGVVVLFLGLEMATRSLRPAPKAQRGQPWVQYIVSFFSGMCSALFGINMFLVAYLQRTAKDYEEFKGSICFLFFGESLFRTVLYACSGLLDATALQFALISMVAAVVSWGIAKPLSVRISEDKLRKLAIVFFLLGGISIIVKSLVFHG